MDILEFSHSIQERSKLFSEVVTACQSLLHTPSAQEVKKYVQSRLSNHSIEKYQIGFFPSTKDLGMLTSLVEPSILKKLRLIYDKTLRGRGFAYQQEQSFFNHHNLVIPFKDEYGNIIALAGRTLLTKQEQQDLSVSKYKNTFYDKFLHLYGLDMATDAMDRSDSAIVVEGQIDCITCHAHGIFNTVALTGSGLSNYQVFSLKKRVNKIYLLLDQDEPGQKATHNIINNFSEFIDISVLTLPEGFKDVDDYLRTSPVCSIFDQCLAS